MTDDSTDTPKSPLETAVEHAVETFVYAPIGLLFEGASLLPQLVEKGRNQVTMARMLGKFAVDQGRTEATKAAGKLGDQAAGVLDFIGGSLAGPPAAEEDAAATRPARPSRPRGGSRNGPAKQAARKVAGVTEQGAAAPSAPRTPAQPAAVAPAPAPSSARSDGAGALAIPDYDGLSASHVVNRLAGLSAEELEAVRRYEAANRGRKTILSKVAQLQSS